MSKLIIFTKLWDFCEFFFIYFFSCKPYDAYTSMALLRVKCQKIRQKTIVHSLFYIKMTVRRLFYAKITFFLAFFSILNLQKSKNRVSYTLLA